MEAKTESVNTATICEVRKKQRQCMAILRKDHILTFCVVQNRGHILELFQHTLCHPFTLHCTWLGVSKACAMSINNNTCVGSKVIEIHARHTLQIHKPSIYMFLCYCAITLAWRPFQEKTSCLTALGQFHSPSQTSTGPSCFC